MANYKYPADYRAHAVQLWRTSGKSQRAVSLELGTPTSSCGAGSAEELRLLRAEVKTLRIAVPVRFHADGRESLHPRHIENRSRAPRPAPRSLGRQRVADAERTSLCSRGMQPGSCNLRISPTGPLTESSSRPEESSRPVDRPGPLITRRLPDPAGWVA
jgi:hypothetical protein